LKHALLKAAEGNNEGEDQAGTGGTDPMKGIPISIAAMEDKVREVAKKI
jgi:hypothetical protein